MKSEKILFSKTIFFNNIKRMWPFWSMAIVCGFFCIMSYCSTIIDRRSWNEALNSNYSKALCVDTLTSFLPLFLFFYAAIIGVGVWFYFYTQRGSVFMNSLPVGRKGLFFTNFLSGMFMIILPCLLTLVGFTAVSAALGLYSKGLFWIALATILVESLMLFAIESLVAVITGLVPANIVIYVFFNYMFVLMEMLFAKTSSKFWYGIDYECDYKMAFFSPVFYFTNKMSCVRNYADSDYESVLSGITLENFDKLWLFLLMGIVVTAIAYYFNMKRNNETATEVLSFKIVKGFLLFIVVLLGTVSGAGYIHAIIHNFSDITYNIFEILIYAFAAGFLCMFLGLMITEKTAKVFNKANFFKYASLMLVAVVILCVFSIDPAHKVAYKPDASELKRIDVKISDNSIYIYPDEKELLDKFEVLRSLIISEGDRRKGEGDRNSTWVQFRYHLQDGKTICREYYVPIYSGNKEAESSLENSIEELINMREIQRKRLFVDSNQFELKYAYLNIYRDEMSYNYSFKTDELSGLQGALEKDVAAGNISEVKLFYDENESDYSEMYNLTLECRNLDDIPDNDNIYAPYAWTEISPNMIYTMEYINSVTPILENN